MDNLENAPQDNAQDVAQEPVQETAQDAPQEEVAPVEAPVVDAVVSDVAPEADAAVVEPVVVDAPASDAMPVERQESAHEQQAMPNPKAALQPGRPFVASDDLLGEIDTSIHEAEQKGEHGLSAELQSVKLKIGDLLTHLKTIATDASNPIYEKIMSFFRKS